jgi:hypothetical protein
MCLYGIHRDNFTSIDPVKQPDLECSSVATECLCLLCLMELTQASADFSVQKLFFSNTNCRFSKKNYSDSIFIDELTDNMEPSP